jgi:signal transduction histidine kinase
MVKMYNDQERDFVRRVESAAYKTIFKAFRMDAIPGLQAAEKVKIDLNAFSLYFTPNLLELDITQPYALQILDCTSDNRVIMRSGDLESLGEKVHISEIPIDDDSIFALRLIIKLPYGEFWGRMWVLLLSSIGSVILLSGILFYLLRTMFRQKTMDQMRRDFTHNITHELKTPISVAVAATDAMRNFSAEADVERRSRYLQIIETQLGQLGAMVERILSVSVEGHRERCNKEEIFFFPMISCLLRIAPIRSSILPGFLLFQEFSVKAVNFLACGLLVLKLHNCTASCLLQSLCQVSVCWPERQNLPAACQILKEFACKDCSRLRLFPQRQQ